MIKSYKKIVQERQLREGRLCNSSKAWTSQDFQHALKRYLQGAGFKTIGSELKRYYSAVEDVIKNDLPRNYRDCLTIHFVSNDARDFDELTHREAVYIRLLLDHKRTIAEVGMVVCRSPEQVQLIVNDL